MTNPFRSIEHPYFRWRDLHETEIISTLVRREEDCLITLTYEQARYELSVRLDGSVGLRRNGQTTGGFQLENIADLDALLHSLSFSMLSLAAQSQVLAP